ncbi:hypothetical protein ACX3PU_03570 [Chryseobacterium sp. A301]
MTVQNRKYVSKKLLPVLFLVFSLLFAGKLEAQKRLNDPSIVNQQKRMVYESWGNFSPYPKYLLGVQTNFAYATVWGFWAPARNRAYKEGPDLRPLRLGGAESERLLSLKVQEKETERVATSVDSLHKQSLLDLSYHTSVIQSSEPLWQLYYKEKLEPILAYPQVPTHFTDWNLKSEKSLLALSRNGGLSPLTEELALIKSKYRLASKSVLPRGKRILLYHACLMDLRAFERNLQHEVLLSEVHDRSSFYLSENRSFYPTNSFVQLEGFSKSDKQIVRELLTQWKQTS